MAIPFARPFVDNSQQTARLSDLIRLRGQTEAEGIRERGAIWGGLAQNVAGSMSELGKRLADEPRRKLQQAQEDKWVRENRREEALINAQKKIAGLSVDEGAKVLAGLGFTKEAQAMLAQDLDQKTGRLNFVEAQHKALKMRAGELTQQLFGVARITDPTKKQEAWSLARQGVGELNPALAAGLPEAPPADPNDPLWASIAEYDMEVKDVLSTRLAAVKAARDAKLTISALTDLALKNISTIRDQNGLTAALAEADNLDPAVGRAVRAIVGETYTPDVAKIVKARLNAGDPTPRLTLEETYLETGDPALLAGHKQWAQAGQRPPAAQAGQRPPAAQASVRGDGTVLERPPVGSEEREFIAGGSLTKKAAWEHSINALLTGKNPYNSRTADPKFKANFDAITNTSAGLVQDGSSLPALQAAYKGLLASEQGMIKKYIDTKSFVESALLGIEQAEGLSENYTRTNIPKVNDIKIWWGRNINSDPKLAAAEVFVFNTARDYAKATSGAAGSIQQMTDAQIKASELLLALRQGQPAFLAALGSMKQDMANGLTAQRNAIHTTNTSILGLSDQVFGRPDDLADVPGVIRAPSAQRELGTGTSYRLSGPRGEVVEFDTPQQRDQALQSAEGRGWKVAEDRPTPAGRPSTGSTTPRVGETRTWNGETRTWNGTAWVRR